MRAIREPWNREGYYDIPNFWAWDLTSNTFSISDNVNAILSLPSQTINNLDTLKSRLFSIDTKWLDFNIVKELTKNENYFEQKIRLYNAEGNFQFFQINGYVELRDALNYAALVKGTFTHISYLVEHPEKLPQPPVHKTEFELIIKGIEAGIWDWDLQYDTLWWSSKFYELLGYQDGEVNTSFNAFFNSLLHQDDRRKVEKLLEEHLYQRKPYKTEIRLLCRSGEYKWFQTSGQALWNSEGKPIKMAGSIIDITETVNHRSALLKNEFLLNESAKLARIGAWEVDLITQEVYWSESTKAIYEYPSNLKTPSLPEALLYYPEASRDIFSKAFNESIALGKSFDISCEFLTYAQNKIWVRVIGSPLFDIQGTIIGVRGVIKNIDEEKQKELFLQDSLKIIHEQNRKLVNFAHIVSHNLRSHTGNLEMVSNFIEECDTEYEQRLLLDNVKQISKQLSETIAQLNEVLVTQSQVQQPKVRICFDDILTKVKSMIQSELVLSGAHIKSNFTRCESVYYIPAYLESILINLLSNAIQFRKPAMCPEITLSSWIENNKIILQIEDNGMGIDLEKYKYKLFGMHHTFHKHTSGKGFGLFLIKNQLDLMGSKIEVESQENIGTTFKITF
ncbi:PAS domain-containing protein [Flectobacillus sp. BAB-3569]|uniref:sensor histidine kinase n=1 Tax=Flectobacillus sp. BAB-3569 TaxID=1509483 RepID=UPI000BA306CF|nr:PAS domain-containing protein [Flectobacillus sp. BAB-3569]PAC26625.1 hypothetical protein BWI92_25380 [Flectobacillus sp. BAB-3569]